MVDRGDQRYAHALQIEQRIAETLVVMDDVVGITVRTQVLQHTPTEDLRFGETTGQLAQPFDHIAQ